MATDKGCTRDAIVRCAKCGGETTPGTRKCIKCGRNLLPVFLALVGTINIIGAAIVFCLFFMMGLTHPKFLLVPKILLVLLCSLFGIVLNYNLVRGRYWAWLATIVLSCVFGILGIAGIAKSIVFQDTEGIAQAIGFFLGSAIWVMYLDGKNVRAFCSVGKNARTVARTLVVASVVVIIPAVALGSQMFKDTGRVSWAEVLERVTKVKAYRYRMKMDVRSIEGLSESKVRKVEIEAKVSAEHGMFMNSYMNGNLISLAFTQIQEQAMVTVFPEPKKYMRVLFTDETFKKIREENHDPKHIVDCFLAGEYTELGFGKIDGITVEGVESTNEDLARGMLGNVVGGLWVDVETGWPVQITIEILDDSGETLMGMVMEDFEWDVEVDASEFAVEIPEDYELMAELDIGQLETGELIANGLRFFADATEGRYPSELTMMTISQELAEVRSSKIASGASKELSQEDMQSMMGLQIAGGFFIGLTNGDKDPAYYGETVTAADVDKVLLRWKLDDGQYRVIYGDLRIEDVIAEKLAELEAD